MSNKNLKLIVVGMIIISVIALAVAFLCNCTYFDKFMYVIMIIRGMTLYMKLSDEFKFDGIDWIWIGVIYVGAIVLTFANLFE